MELFDPSKPVEFVIDDPADITPVTPEEFMGTVRNCRPSLAPMDDAGSQGGHEDAPLQGN